MDTHETTPEAAQLRALRSARRSATLALVVAGLLYVGLQWPAEPGFWIQLIRAGSEAALVGGLADWFAVTALFRRPFGLPIPHTAILPRNKNRLGAGLGRFIERHFLAPEPLAQRLRDYNPTGRAARWLCDPGHSAMVAARIAAALPFILNALEEHGLRRFLRDALSTPLRTTNPLPFLGRLVEILVESPDYQPVLDRGLVQARRWLRQNEALIYERVSEHTRWWIPRRIDRRVARAIVQGVEEWLTDLAQPGNEVRRQFDEAVRDWAKRMQDNREPSPRLIAIRERLLDSPELQAYLESLWEPVRKLLLEAAEAREPELERSLATALSSIGHTLDRDEATQQRLNRRLEAFLLRQVLPYRSEIGRFIADVVRQWDTRTVTERLELAVGRDLQFIRINGTVVGALVGCVLFLGETLIARWH